MAIINSGIERANANYTKKYNKMVGEAVKSQNTEMKQMMCAAMASSEPQCAEYGITESGDAVCAKYETTNFDALFAKSGNTGIVAVPEDSYATRYVISGADMSQLADVLSSGHSEFVQTDSYGNMLGRITTSAYYSTANNTCTLTTESLVCKNAEAVITTDDHSSTSCGFGGLSLAGGGGCRGFGGILNIGGGKKTQHTDITQSYHGTSCKEFGEPVLTTNVIEM